VVIEGRGERGERVDREDVVVAVRRVQSHDFDVHRHETNWRGFDRSRRTKGLVGTGGGVGPRVCMWWSLRMYSVKYFTLYTPVSCSTVYTREIGTGFF
jgi:hypothetical protein